MRRFQRIYLEISNICNLQCSFCPVVERDKKIMSPEDFERILPTLLPWTEYLCLHLMGEPLGHPDFQKILEICDRHEVKVQLTTNGTLLKKFNFDTFLKSKSLVQINFSLHSFKDNFPEEDFRPYLYDVMQFSKEAIEKRPELYINYRLWNLHQSQILGKNDENLEILDEISGFFQLPIKLRVDVSHRKNKNILSRLYLHFDSRFDWPTLSGPDFGDSGFCHGLSQHIGIHADGTVVPCCLDKEAELALGNIYQESFESIIHNEKAKRILAGFQRHQLVEELCRHCQYITRFKKTAPTKNELIKNFA